MAYELRIYGQEGDKMEAYNCQEFEKFGAEPGRVCWVMPETMCEGMIQGIFIKKFDECESCEFYQKIKEEEKEKFISRML